MFKNIANELDVVAAKMDTKVSYSSQADQITFHVNLKAYRTADEPESFEVMVAGSKALKVRISSADAAGLEVLASRLEQAAKDVRSQMHKFIKNE